MINRMAEIKQKGFDMVQTEEYQIPENAESYVPMDFAKIKVGAKTLSDAILKLGDFQRANPNIANKQIVLKAIHDSNFEKMR